MYFPELADDASARIVETTYDCLRGRYKEVTIDYMSAEAAGGKRSFTITRFTTGTQQNNILFVDVEINGPRKGIKSTILLGGAIKRGNAK